MFTLVQYMKIAVNSNPESERKYATLYQCWRQISEHKNKKYCNMYP